MYTVDFDYEFNDDLKLINFYAPDRFIVPVVPHYYGHEHLTMAGTNNNSDACYQLWKRSQSSYEGYWQNISRPNVHTLYRPHSLFLQ